MRRKPISIENLYAVVVCRLGFAIIYKDVLIAAFLKID